MALDAPGLQALFAPLPLVPDAKEYEVCGSPIDPHPLKRFCSNSCRQKARYARESKAKPQRRRAVGPPKIVGERDEPVDLSREAGRERLRRSGR